MPRAADGVTVPDNAADAVGLGPWAIRWTEPFLEFIGEAQAEHGKLTPAGRAWAAAASADMRRRTGLPPAEPAGPDDKSDEKSVEWGIFRVAAVQATAVFYICCANQFPHSHLHSQAS